MSWFRLLWSDMKSVIPLFCTSWSATRFCECYAGFWVLQGNLSQMTDSTPWTDCKSFKFSVDQSCGIILIFFTCFKFKCLKVSDKNSYNLWRCLKFVGWCLGSGTRIRNEFIFACLLVPLQKCCFLKNWWLFALHLPSTRCLVFSKHESVLAKGFSTHSGNM